MTDTTTHGLPYPEATDPVSQGAAAIQALAEATDTLLYGTAWTPLTLLNSWTHYSGSVPSFRLVGDAVELRGIIGGGASATVAATLPAGHRPPATTNCPATGTGGFAYLEVDAAGNVKVTASGPTWVDLNSRFATTA